MEWYSKWVVMMSVLRVVRRVLHRTEIVDFFVAGNDHHAAGVLTGGALDARTARGQPVLLRLGHG